MKPFMDNQFLLATKTAEALYHEYAEPMPIYDYHCHLSPREIAEDIRFANITEAWLGGDHYKWRAMRSNGIDERFITGDAPAREKFQKWAETMPYCLGNPLYHWAHLELRRFFNIDTILGPDTAEEIWTACNKQLSEPSFSAKQLIMRSNVKCLCTTDDPTDTLEYHQKIAQDASFTCRVLPTFRPDTGLAIEKPAFTEWIQKLAKSENMSITDFESLKAAFRSSLNRFSTANCKLSDHALEPVFYEEGTIEEANTALITALSGGALDQRQIDIYKTQLFLFLGREYAQRGWVMQLHIGTMRNCNTRQLSQLGINTGFDTIGDAPFARSLSRLLDGLDMTNELPKSILYCLNPRDNEVLGTLIGCFQGGIPGKIQFGSGWWFNDQKDGMLRQMTALANLGLLPRFVGMLTDSRSFLSYTRHEYFRRILCNMVGTWAEEGELPNELPLLGKMISDICWSNAEAYFG